MKKIICLFIGVLFIISCTTIPEHNIEKNNIWKSVSQIDRFTDVETKMVTIGDFSNKNFVLTTPFQYYPFVSLRGNEIAFGIRSGGNYKIPTGTVQIRIDNNKAWTITPSETPIYLEITSSENMFGVNMSSIITQNMSPFTASTGDKAKDIIREMLSGREMIYRTVGYNQAASTEGHIIIDSSFRESLRQIGITEDMLK